jgi:hypothetical protein
MASSAPISARQAEHRRPMTLPTIAASPPACEVPPRARHAGGATSAAVPISEQREQREGPPSSSRKPS